MKQGLCCPERLPVICKYEYVTLAIWQRGLWSIYIYLFIYLFIHLFMEQGVTSLCSRKHPRLLSGTYRITGRDRQRQFVWLPLDATALRLQLKHGAEWHDYLPPFSPIIIRHKGGYRNHTNFKNFYKFRFSVIQIGLKSKIYIVTIPDEKYNSFYAKFSVIVHNLYFGKPKIKNKNIFLWNLMPCSSVYGCQCFGRTSFLHIQDCCWFYQNIRQLIHTDGSLRRCTV
jgi:hypothetical protein